MSKPKRNDDGTFGINIELNPANDMIQEHLDLDNLIVKTVPYQPGHDTNQRDRAYTFVNHKHNAFIFSKKFIARFWNDSEVDSSGNKVNADHIMVILGAHTENETSADFEKGEPTVIVAGVNEITDGPKKGQFASLPIDKPACEYPPCQIITSIGPDGGTLPENAGDDSDPAPSSGKSVLYFKIDG